MSDYELKCGDALAVLKTMESESVQCCVTSPPYFGLRDYGHDGQIGQEPTLVEYVARLVDVFGEVRRVLKDDGTCWVNLGDAMKDKNRVGIPHRVVFALQDAGWIWRDEIVWSKPNPMPESVTDRTTKAHEFIFLLAKQPVYYYDAAAVVEPAIGDPSKNKGNRRRFNGGHDVGGDRQDNLRNDPTPISTRNKRSVWTCSTAMYPGAHFATFPKELIKPCVLAGSRVGDTVLDCFNGSGTTGAVALEQGRSYIGIELNPEYIDLSVKRLEAVQPRLSFEQVSP
jgi:DNA modification methylase